MDVKVTGLDHIVLNAADVERSLEYYSGVLGLPGERVEEWRRGEAPFPSVRVDGGTIIDLFAAGEPPSRSGGNLDHFCLVLETADWEEMVASGTVEIVRGPSQVFGARGTGVSVYTHDPDGNTVELRHYRG